MTLNRTIIPFLLLLLTTSFMFTSCVGKKKFLREIGTRDSTLMHLNGRVLQLNRDIAQLNLQLAGKEGEVRALKDLNEKQDAKIKKLEQEVEKTINKSLSQQQLMDLALQKKAEEVAEKEQVIKNMQDAIERQEQAMKNLLGNIQAALQQYNQAELSLEVKEGKAYVGLSEKLLFKSGSADLSKDAMGVLGKIAQILNQHPELSIIVEGHTDNVPIKTRDFKDNWDLSVIRATTVARIMTKEFELNPNQVTAAGRAEFAPKASNETPGGKALNRRTEIIIAPSLDEVFKLLEESSVGGN